MAAAFISAVCGNRKSERHRRKTAKLVRNLTGDKIVDLLWHLPSSIIDRRYSPRLANARIGSIVTVKIRVLEHIEPKLKKLPYKIVCTDGSEEITLSFFTLIRKR